MSILYITEQGAKIRKRGERLIVDKRGEELLEIPYDKIDTILVYGNVQFTTQALSQLLEHQIELALLSQNGRLKGQLTPIKSKNIVLRMKQYEKSQDQNFSLNFSKKIVSGKLKNSLDVVRRFSYNHPEVDLSEEIRSIESSIESLEHIGALESLVGTEGAGAKSYFSGFKQMLLKDFDFPGRKKRPPTDPVNALLSFGYTLLVNEIHSLLDGMGFDPYLGFFHQIEYGRPSLALDLLEEFRQPCIDRLTLNLLNLGILREEDFYEDKTTGGRYLRKPAMKTYFQYFEKWMQHGGFTSEERETNFRKAIRNQAEKLARCLTENEPYATFSLVV